MPRDSDDRQQDVPSVAPGVQQTRLMLATIARRAEAFRLAKRVDLSPRHMPANYLKIFLASLYDAAEMYKKLPTYAQMFAYVDSKIASLGAVVSEDDTAQLDELLDDVYRQIKSEDLDVAIAGKTISKVIEMSIGNEVVAAIHRGTALSSIMESAQSKVRAADAAAVGTLAQPFPKDETVSDLVQLVKTETGCPFFDKYMDGFVAGEVYGVCAPWAVGKTLLTVQLAASRAEAAYAAWRIDGQKGRIPTIYIAVWEEELSSLRIRFMSNMARIDKTLLEEGRLDKLSTCEDPSTYKPYERKRAADLAKAGVKLLGEKERIARAKRIINSCVRFVDFTGADQALFEHAKHMGKGLARVIEADQAANGEPGVGLVIIDHANAAADTACDLNNLQADRHKRHLIGGFPRQVKQMIANRFGCAAWIMHQLKAEHNSRAAGVAPKASETAEAKNFFEYCNFGFMLGTKTKDELAILTCVKARRKGAYPDTILRINGALQRAEDTQGQFCVAHNKIMSITEARSVSEPENNTDEGEDGFYDDDNDSGSQRDVGL